MTLQMLQAATNPSQASDSEYPLDVSDEAEAKAWAESIGNSQGVGEVIDYDDYDASGLDFTDDADRIG